MGALFRTEMTKQWRRPRTYAALGITILIPVIFAIAIKANPPAPNGANDPFTYLATHTGLFLPVAALRFMSRFLLVFLVALFVGDAVASEASWGNLRAMLTRPVDRSRLLVVKVESAGLLASIATVLIVVTGLVAGGVAFRVERAERGRRARVGVPPVGRLHHREPRPVERLRVLEPRRRGCGGVHGVDDDRLAGRRGLRRLRPLRHLPDPRRHHVARLDALRVPHPLLRLVDRPVPRARPDRRHAARDAAADPVRPGVRRDRLVVLPSQGRAVVAEADAVGPRPGGRHRPPRPPDGLRRTRAGRGLLGLGGMAGNGPPAGHPPILPGLAARCPGPPDGHPRRWVAVASPRTRAAPRPLSHRHPGRCELGGLSSCPAPGAAEFVGTALIMLVGLSAVTFDFATHSPMQHWVHSVELRRLIAGIVFAGTGAAVIYSTLGRRSGGHFNPAMTLAFRRLHKIDAPGALAYGAAQLAGAGVAALTVRFAWGSWATSVHVGATLPGQPGTVVTLVVETALTFVLATLVFECVDRPRWMPYTAALAALSSRSSSSSRHPCRVPASTRRAASARRWPRAPGPTVWIYAIAPRLGALLAAGLFLRTRGSIMCAKLFHTDEYRCPFFDCQYTPPGERRAATAHHHRGSDRRRAARRAR